MKQKACAFASAKRAFYTGVLWAYAIPHTDVFCLHSPAGRKDGKQTLEQERKALADGEALWFCDSLYT